MSKSGNKLDPSFWLSLFFVGAITVWVVTAARWDWDTRLFPWAIGMPALALALFQLAADWRGPKKGQREEVRYEARYSEVLDIPVDRSIPPEVMMRHTVKAASWIIAFASGIWFLGFLISIPLFIFSYLIYEAQAGKFGALLTAGLTLLFIWAVFDVMMHLAWPEAMLFSLLGY